MSTARRFLVAPHSSTTRAMDAVVDRVRRSEAFASLKRDARAFGASRAMEILSDAKSSSSALDAVRTLAHDALHAGKWSAVDERWRAVYAMSAIAWTAKSETRGAKATRALDLAVVLGGETFGDDARAAIEATRVKVDRDINVFSGRWDVGVDEAVAARATRATGGVERRAYARTSMETFYREYMAKRDDASENGWNELGRPVVLEGLATHWPAVAKWCDRAYLDDVIGDRTVPVEVGKTYVDEHWSQKLMTVREFMDQYLGEGGEQSEQGRNVGYLAQHELFEQCPELKRDIETPLYCSLGSGGPCAVNAWFGPANTESPAHTDPKHNILCQIVGVKRVRLFAPNQTPRMYPREPPSSNTSRVDVAAPDLEQFPLFSDAEFVDAVLLPGDAIYIPPEWWHHVVADTPSFSVSFWWD